MADYLNAKGWLTEKERRLLFVLAQTVEEGATMLNIGVEYGASIVCLCEGNHKAEVVGVDIKEPQDDQVRAYGNFRFILKDSNVLVAKWRQPIALLFVDGDHSEYACGQDALFARHVQKGGYALFHDCYAWDSPGAPHRTFPAMNNAVSAWFALNKDKWNEQPFTDSIRVFKRL